MLWYKFKHWVADPYEKKAEELKKELISHKRQMNEAIIVTQQQSEAIHKELKETHEAIHKTISQQLARAEQVNRQQLELTLKTVAEQEEELKRKITDFTQQATGNLAMITDNVRDLQQNKNAMKEITTKLQSQQQEILKHVQKIKEGEQQLLLLLRTKPLVTSSPRSAPVGGSSLAVPLPSPQSAQDHMSVTKVTPALQKRGLLARLSRNRSGSAAPSPSPVVRPASAPEKDTEHIEHKRISQTPPLALAHQ